ncbi:MAG: Alkaline phosphatase [Acidimicrobiales bacterium]|nr:Alkaline phosphatase [Acidimicrobiales bacterium]
MARSARYSAVTAAVLPRDLAAVSAVTQVRYVSEILAPFVGDRAYGSPASRGSRAPSAPVGTAGCNPTISEGDSALNGPAARAASGEDGTGVTVGVLSDSFNKATYAPTHASADIASGDLPGATNPCGHLSPVVVQSDYSGGDATDEGRAMVQIVHDLAPGAQPAFGTVTQGQVAFADQIDQMVSIGRANVIVDDVEYLDEPFFQNGPVAVAADAASAAGTTYLSAAGNGSVLVGGDDVSSYEAPQFRPTACPAAIAAQGAASCHDFDPAGSGASSDVITVAPQGSLGIDLQWAQPWGGVTANYDLFLEDAADHIIGSSTIDSAAFGEPVEFANWTNNSGTAVPVHVVIAKKGAGPDVRLKFAMFASNGAVTAVDHASSDGTDIIGPSISGHAGASSVGATAAVPYNDADTTEPFSSHGPVTRYFADVPQTTALASPVAVHKPDFAATDGVRTTFFAQKIAGVWRFYGTSAAAPHAAAIAALILAKNPTLTPLQVLTAMRSTARPIATNGTLDEAGAGYLDARAAVDAVPARPGAPQAVVGMPGNHQATVTWSPPLITGGEPVTSYHVATFAGSNVVAEADVNAPTRTVSVPGLTNGTAYRFVVTANNQFGPGPDSTQSVPLTIGVPLAPTSPRLDVGDTTATVSWAPPAAANAGPITSYSVTLHVVTWMATDITLTAASTATKQMFTGLSNGSSVRAYVVANNSIGPGIASATTSYVSVGIPSTPTNVRAVSTTTGAQVTWAAPATGVAPTGYWVFPHAGTADLDPIYLNNLQGTTVAVPIATGSTASFMVRADNNYGKGPQSAPTAPIIIGAPTAPTSVAATPTNGGATVRWTPGSALGSTMSSFRVTPYHGFVALPVRVVTPTTTSLTIIGLTNGQSYTFQVAGLNGVGLGAPASSMPLVIGIPLPPGGVTATPGNGQATVHWAAPSPNGSAITSYVVTPYLAGVAQPRRTYLSAANTQTVSGLTNAKTYTFKVAATNARGTGSTSAASPATIVGTPVAPTHVTAVAGTAKATLTWTAPVTNNGAAISAYIVTAFAAGVVKQVRRYASAATTEVMASLQTGTAYTFTVAAVNIRGTGPRSLASAAMTPH